MLNYLFIGNSVYALFLYCIRFYNQINETLFLLGPSCTFAQVNHCLPMCAPREQSDLQATRQALYQQVYLLLNGRKVPAYGNVATVFSPFFTKNFTFHPISDGLVDTVTFPEYVKDPNFPKCYTVRYREGLDFEHPKMEYIDIQKQWASLTPDQQKHVADIFCLDPKMLAQLSRIKKLLITQPLSEDNIYSFEDKIEIYKRILSNYDLNEVALKPHPRETTKWAEVLPNVMLLPKHFPVEILSNFAQFDKIITFFSTAAFNMLDESCIDFYSKDFAQLKSYSDEMKGYQVGDHLYRNVSSFDVEKTYQNYRFNWLRIPDPDGRFYRS